MALLLRRAWKRRGGRQDAPQSLWRYFFAIVIGVFLITLVSFWILISPRDYLPMMPLGAIFVAAALDRHELPPVLASLACLAAAALLVVFTVAFHRAAPPHQRTLR